jgi:hypothetical protein
MNVMNMKTFIRAAAGTFVAGLAVGDLLLGMVVLIGLPRATGRTAARLLADA